MTECFIVLIALFPTCDRIDFHEDLRMRTDGTRERGLGADEEAECDVLALRHLPRFEICRAWVVGSAAPPTVADPSF